MAEEDREETLRAARRAVEEDRHARNHGAIPWVDTINQLSEADHRAFEQQQQTPAQQFEAMREGLRQMEAEQPGVAMRGPAEMMEWANEKPDPQLNHLYAQRAQAEGPLDRLKSWWQERQVAALETQGAAWRAQHTERLSQIVAAKREQAQEKDNGRGYEPDPIAEVLIEVYDALADAKGKVHKGKILGILDRLANQERDDQKMLSILEVLQARPSLDNQSIARLTADELARDRQPEVVQMPISTGTPWWLLVTVLLLAFVAGMATTYVLVDWQVPPAPTTQSVPGKRGR